MSRLSSSIDVARLSADLHADIGLRLIATGLEALDSLRDAVEGPAVVLTDSVPKLRRGEDLLVEVERRLPGGARRAVLDGRDGRVHADEATLETAAGLAAGSEWLVTVGSGTLADIGKAVSTRHEGMRHVVVQTATSVNGFADDQSVLLVNGVKRTTHTRWPDTLIADADVLVAAPVALNLAGVGDLLAMFTAPADWKLAHMLGMADSYSSDVVSLVRSHGPKVLELAPRLGAGDRDAATAIAEVLALSGVSMGAAGTTAPASGMEHTVSHLIEMAMNRQGRDAAFHGAQVGVTSIVASVLWSRVRRRLQSRRVTLEFPSDAEMSNRVQAAFAQLDPSGAMAAECWRLYTKKLRRWRDGGAAIAGVDWGRIDSAVGELLADPAELAGSLARAAAPVRFAALDPPVDAALVRWALLNCHLMRDRFTVADLAFFSGEWDEAAVDSVLGEAAAFGAGL